MAALFTKGFLWGMLAVQSRLFPQEGITVQCFILLGLLAMHSSVCPQEGSTVHKRTSMGAAGSAFWHFPTRGQHCSRKDFYGDCWPCILAFFHRRAALSSVLFYGGAGHAF